MSDLTGPPDEADEADVAEQHRPLTDDEDDTAPLPTATPEEANEADALEQSLEVTEDDEDYSHEG